MTDTLFQEDKCFKLLIDSPYLNSDLYFPWSADNPPVCELDDLYKRVVGSVTCRIGEKDNELLFNFSGFRKSRLKQLTFYITNFRNPWSAITLESNRIMSYDNSDCSGSVVSSKKIGDHTYYPLTLPSGSFKITSSTDVLGYADLSNEVIFKWTPQYTMGVDGRGKISIRIPNWYNVRGKLNMMFNEK